MLSEQTLNQLFRYALSLVNDQQKAEDLLHSALEKWLGNRQNINHSMVYLRTIIRNLFIDDCRKQAIIHFEPLVDSHLMVFETQALDDLTINQEEVSAIFAILNSAEREVLFLWAVEGYSVTEIADELGQPRGTVLSRLYRLREKIKQSPQLIGVGQRGGYD